MGCFGLFKTNHYKYSMFVFHLNPSVVNLCKFSRFVSPTLKVKPCKRNSELHRTSTMVSCPHRPESGRRRYTSNHCPRAERLQTVWNGPDFLLEKLQDWPKSKVVPKIETTELKQTIFLSVRSLQKALFTEEFKKLHRRHFSVNRHYDGLRYTDISPLIQ